ncbi:MAG: SpoIIE family protein phosphatase [Verrucomicrobiota bacterium]
MAKAHILIVEDEILVARELEARLMAMGYEVDGIAGSAAEGIRMAVEKKPEIVLMDIVLKGEMDGIEAAGEIRSQMDIPSIYVTAYCDEETLERAKLTQPYGYLIKPFSESDLRATLEIALHQRHTDLELKKTHLDLQHLTHELQIRNEQLESELKIAHQMQIAMLPSRFPSIPQGVSPADSALSFYSVYTPSGQISGDFFNVIRISDTAAGVFICDVMGHNVSAALVTSMIRALVEEFSAYPDAAYPGKLLTRINKVLSRVFEQNQTVVFATAFYLIADVATSRISFANAAHPSPLYLCRGKNDAMPVQDTRAQGPALGLFKDAVYHSRERPMASGDSVMLFTDGIFEVEGPDDEQYSQSRLVEAVSKRIHLPSGQLFSELLDDVRSFANGREFPDDVCLVGMEVKRCGENGDFGR